MAAPTPMTYTRQIGHKGVTIWNAVWSTTDNISDGVVVDLSGLGFNYTNNVRVEKIFHSQTAGIEFTLEFDATTDQFIYSSVLADASASDTIDFTSHGLDGLVKTAAGGSGDLLITTTSAASGDEITLVVWWHAD